MSDHIQYDYLYDNHFAELKDAELMQERLGLVATADPYIGRYYSVNYIRRKILRQTDQEITEEDAIMEAEREDGTIPPTEQELMMMQQEQESKSRTSKQNLGKTQTEGDKESIDTSKTEDPDSPGTPDLKGGEI